MHLIIKENTKILKTKQKIIKDSYLNRLISLLTTNSQYFSLMNFVRMLFYNKTMDEYETTTKYMQLRYENAIEEVKEIYSIFKSWKPFEKYELSEIRGIFLEQITYKILERKYNSEQIFHEAKIIKDTLKTYDLDFIVKLKEKILTYECKFSSRSLKKHQLDNLAKLNSLLNNINIFLVFFERRNEIEQKLKKINEQSKNYDTKNFLDSVQIISLENFTENKFFN